MPSILLLLIIIPIRFYTYSMLWTYLHREIGNVYYFVLLVKLCKRICISGCCDFDQPCFATSVMSKSLVRFSLCNRACNASKLGFVNAILYKYDFKKKTLHLILWSEGKRLLKIYLNAKKFRICRWVGLNNYKNVGKPISILLDIKL